MSFQSAPDTPARAPLSEHLQSVTEALAAAHSQAAVLQIVLTPALEALAAMAGAILLLDAAGARLEIAATQGHGAQTLWQGGPLDSATPAGQALASREALFFEHAGDLGRAFPNLEAQTGGVAAVASAVLPMVLDGQPLGALMLDFSEPHSFSAEERRFLGTLAAQCAVALGRARLTADLERRVEERTRQSAEARSQAEVLAALGDTLQLATTPEQVAEQALERLGPALHAQSMLVVRLDGEGIRLPTLWGETPEVVVAYMTRPGLTLGETPMLHRAAQEGRGIYLGDYQAERGAVRSFPALASGVEPIHRPGGTLEGFLVVWRPTARGVWHPAERELLRRAADTLGLALERAATAAQLEAHTRQIEEAARAQEAFVAFTEAVGSETDVLVLARQAFEVLRARFPDASLAYLERRGELWQARAWSEGLRAELVALITAGLPGSSPMLAPVLHTRQPVFTDVWQPEWEGPGHVRDHTTLYSTLGNYPLLIAGEVRGILSIGLETVRQWSQRDQALIRAVGRGLNLALERAEQARQLEEERAALEAFAAFSEAVGAETDALALTRQALEVLRGRFGDNSLFVYYEREDDLWKARLWTDDLDAQPQLRATLQAGLALDTPLYAEAARTGQPVFTENWDAGREQITNTEAYGAGANYPLRVGGEVRAMLSAGLRGNQRWQPLDRALIRAVGRGLALALERAEQAQRLAAQNAELEARTRALEGFADLTRDLSALADPYTLIRRAQEVALGLLSPGFAVYYELEDKLWRLKSRVGELGNPALQALADAGFPREIPTLLTPWVTRQPMYQDVYEQGADSPAEIIRHVHAAASLPLMTSGTPVGVFAIGLFDQRAWTAVDRAVLETVTHHLGLALERAGAVAQLAQRTGELDRERTFLRAVLESLREGVVACDPDGNLTLFNDAARAFHGQSASPLPPEAWAGHYDLFEGDGTTPLITDRIPLFRAWRGERVRDAEMVIRPRGGEARSIVANGQAIFTAQGLPLGAVVAMHDITGRKQAEEALLRANEDLRRSNAELEQFAYIASHDLQAPIRAVTSFAGMIARRYGEQLDERGRLYLQQIVDSGEHMKRLVDDLLAFSRVHTEQREPRPTDSGAVFDTVASRLQAEAGETGAGVTRGDLPVVLADGQQLDQLLQNLISNGLKYHRAGVPPRIHVSAERDGHLWRFAVTDNGIGIETQYFDRIFEIFQRLHGREAFEGTGIGLAVCKKIVERHGGEVWLESTPGEGTTFFFTLPGADTDSD
jgi:PAS domain S-box-containing protein